MNTDQEKGPGQAAIGESHLHLREVLEDASRSMSRRETSPADLLEIFDRLRTELLDHFRHEEACGYFGDAIEVAPRLKSRADTLLQQHPDLEAHFDRLRTLVEQGRATDEWWHAVTEEFASFYDAFDQHERRETALLQEAYTRDVGTDD